MNKNIFYILLFIGVIVSFNSCSRTEPDLFDKSAAERMNEAVESIEALLCSSENGWIIDYFPNTRTEGYTYIVKFSPLYMATMAARNKYVTTYTEQESAWNVIKDMGPVLTFNTYNDSFHFFAGPVAPGASEPDGKGLEGDYEFLVLGKTNDVITLKGKKHGAITIARRMSEGKNWEEYINDLDEMKNFLFDSKVTLELKKGNETIYQLLNSTTSIFGQLPPNGNIITDLKNRPFITTDYGFRLCQPLEMDSVKKITIQQFNLNAERNKLISAEDENYTIVGPQPGDFIKGDNSIFLATKEQTTGMDALFDLLKSESISQFNANYEFESIGFGKNNGRPALALYTKNRVTALFNIPLTVEGNQVIIAPFDTQNMLNADMDQNARLFYQRVESIKQLLTVIQGIYTIETSTPLSLRVIKYTKTDGSLTLNVSR